ncbi:hypothetical protein O1611_g9696 [Lasiodiplodia mahajangana]|uniref:Uncharacterized protein n=1 Tax=Lasiodiplodia mahajangana TaxID=1108764 RepID=A0ACC2J765_9PEZI|nr:hypothetical protein O1611_g9696 [Lasiodiplodia mahajangana]
MASMIPLPKEPYLHPHLAPFAQHQVKLIHRNCPRRKKCEITRFWTPSDVKQVPYPPDRYRTPNSPEPKTCWVGSTCCETKNWAGPAHAFIKRIIDSNIPSDAIPAGVLANDYDLLLPFRHCYGDYGTLEDVTIDTFSAAIVWQGEPPLNGQGKAHTCSLTPLHLEIMRQRNCGDSILVEFTATAHKKNGKLNRLVQANQASEPKVSIIAPVSNPQGVPKLPLMSDDILSRMRRSLERIRK